MYLLHDKDELQHRRSSSEVGSRVCMDIFALGNIYLVNFGYIESKVFTVYI